MSEIKKCACCGAHTVIEKYDICPFCGWEQDPSQERFPNETGANPVSLREARENFRRFGSCEGEHKTE